MNGMDAFERSIKNSLEQFEVPYNSADWAQMEKTLDGGGGGGWIGSAGFYAALVASLVVVGGGAWYLTGGPEAVDPSGHTELSVKDDRAMDNATGTGGVIDQAGSFTNGASTSEDMGTGSATDGGEEVPSSNSRKDASANSVTGTTGGQVNSRSSAVDRSQAGTAGTTPEAEKRGAFVASVSEGCEGAAVEFNVPNMPETGIYLWNFGDGSFSNKPNPNHTFTKPGRFTVTLSMSAPGKGAITNEPYADLIVIHEVPEASFNWIRQEYAGHVPSVHFENRSHGGATYFWEFGDGSTSKVAHPDHVYRAKGEYQTRLTVTNEMGCQDIVEKLVKIDNDYNLLAPAAFSPNGDGNEDLFMPQALKDLGVKFHLAIYEPRTGRLVFETSDATNPWTGRLMNRGDLCKPGDYVWMVEIKEGLHLGDIGYEGKVSLVN